jgi:hypothetical protein
VKEQIERIKKSVKIANAIRKKRMPKEILLKRWKESEKRTQVQKPLVFDYIHAEEIIYVAYKVGFINWNVYGTAMERIKKTRNGNWMFIKQKEIKAYEELIEKKYWESLTENAKTT